MTSPELQFQLQSEAAQFLESSSDNDDDDNNDDNIDDDNFLNENENNKNKLDPATKGTPAMQQSLRQLQKQLTCPLCNHVFVEPVTINCGHTFCCQCIDQYVDHNWNCPIKTCKLPVSMKVNCAGRKFRQINPAMQTLVNSWTTICHTMMRAEDYWWQDNGPDDDDDNDNNDNNNMDHDPEKLADPGIMEEAPIVLDLNPKSRDLKDDDDDNDDDEESSMEPNNCMADTDDEHSQCFLTAQ